MKWKRETERLLRQLGINGSYKGFSFVTYSIEKIIQKPELLTHVHKELYEMIALHFGVSPESAERNIRTVKGISWEYGDKELLREIFGSRCAQPPGNAAFLDGLAAYLAEACAIEKEQDRCDRENG